MSRKSNSYIYIYAAVVFIKITACNPPPRETTSIESNSHESTNIDSFCIEKSRELNFREYPHINSWFINAVENDSYNTCDLLQLIKSDTGYQSENKQNILVLGNAEYKKFKNDSINYYRNIFSKITKKNEGVITKADKSVVKTFKEYLKKLTYTDTYAQCLKKNQLLQLEKTDTTSSYFLFNTNDSLTFNIFKCRAIKNKLTFSIENPEIASLIYTTSF